MEITGLIISFIVIILMVTRRINLGLAMLSGSAIISIFSPDIDFFRFFEIILGALDKTTLEIVFIIVNITIIAGVMERTGMVDEMISSLEILFSRYEVTLALVPSIMGALAIPGGAMMSAPMVDNIAKRLDLPRSKKMAINLLFRHIWYFVFPFVPGLVLTAGLMKTDVFYLIKHFFPLTLVLGGTGIFTLFRGMNRLKRQGSFSWDERVKAIKKLIIIFLPLLTGIFLPFFTPLSFAVALTLSVLMIVFMKREKLHIIEVVQSIQWKLVGGIMGIMVFKEFIDNLDALNIIAQRVIEAGMPIWLLAIILPGFVGFITGSTSGAIGITFPLLMPLIGPFQQNMDYLLLMYGSSFFSYYLSPVHFCLILTADYFEVTLKETYRELFWPVFAGVLTVGLLFFIY